MIVDHTKTYVNRQFPITKDLQEFLDRYKLIHGEYYPDSKYLFPSNNSGGDLILASQLFGNSPKTAKSNYYTGLNLEKAKMILEIK